MQTSNKKVLLLAYDFPPRGGSGVFRVAKFARYLPEWGWEPVVITVAGPGPHPDLRLLAELPPLEIIRVPQPTLRPAKNDQAAPIVHAAAPSSVLIAQSSVLIPQSSRLRARLKPWVLPDPQIAWLPAAVRAAQRRLGQGDIAALLTSGPPFSVCLSGYLLKRLHPTLPWLMDMRDMWSEGLYQRHLVRYKLHRALEQACLRAADHTTVVSDGIRDLTIRRLGVAADRISTLTNGFDRADLPAAIPGPAHAGAGPLLIRYVGSIADLRLGAVAGVFEALRQLQAAGVTAAQLRVELIGAFGPQVRALAAPLVATGLVDLQPFVPHAQAVERMAAADLLLLVLTDDWEGRIMHTSKFFEYLAVGRPLLIVGPLGEATKLVLPAGIGLAVPPTDATQIAATLQQLIAQHAAGELPFRTPPPALLRRFERRELAGQLAALLSKLEKEGSHAGA